MQRQFLILDADDTLWENNIYFEAAFEQFCEYLAHSSLSPLDIRGVLDEIEAVNAKVHGYGCRNFARNLGECLRRLAERDIGEADLAAVREFAHAILDKPIELIEGVEETVADLSGRHDLTVFTKGDPEEQRMKIEQSGLARYFQHTAIVKEKDRAAYDRLAVERGLPAERTWMIGNSPKSDINPALAAGLRAVYVPHPRTWSLEREQMPESHPRLLVIRRIRELTEHF
jgi:putative hydrolase of the HAD superfamily